MTFDKLDIGEGVWLTRVQAEDAQEIFALIESCRDYLREWFPWVDSSETSKDTLDFVNRSEEQYAEGNGVQCCIRLEGSIVGVIGCVYLDQINRRTELGYWVGEDYQGRGIATKATRAMTDYAFSEWNLNRVEINTGVDNTKSRAVARRLGFREEGVSREKMWVNDHFVDLVGYAMLRKNWQAT